VTTERPRPGGLFTDPRGGVPGFRDLLPAEAEVLREAQARGGSTVSWTARGSRTHHLPPEQVAGRLAGTVVEG